MVLTPALGVLARIIHDHLKNNKAKAVMEALANGKKAKDDLSESDGEVFRFYLLVDAMNKASTYEKINMLKDAYLAFQAEPEEQDDLYFEILSILGDLSDREIRLLHLLDIYQQNQIESFVGSDAYNDLLSKVNASRGSFLGDDTDIFYYFASRQLSMTAELASALMRRLERSGLIEPTGINANACFQEYRHTELYKEIKSRLFYAMDSMFCQDRLTKENI